MNTRACLGCTLPLEGMRADAKYHAECRPRVRDRHHVQASQAFWGAVGEIRRRGMRTWIRGRERPV